MQNETQPDQWLADVGPSAVWTTYTRGNIGEVYPEVVLPLESSLSWEAAELGWRTGAAKVGFAVPDDFGDEKFVLMGVFGGYAYFNVSIMRLLGVRTPGMGPDLIDAQFLGDADVAAYVPRPGDRRPQATLRVIATALNTMRAKHVPLLDEMRARVASVRDRFPGLEASDKALLDYLRAGYSDDVEFFISSHVINTMQATIASGALADFCEKHLGDPTEALKLTTGIGDVVSAQPAIHLWKIANETPAGEQEAAFGRFLEQFGHRGPNEFSLNGRDWSSFPDLARTAVDTMRDLDADRSPEVQLSRMAASRVAAMAEAKTTLGRKARRLEKLVASVALWSRAREESKDLVIRGNQLGRHAFLELVRRAHARGGVESRTDVMLLTVSELDAYLDDPPSMVDVISSRRERYDELAALEPPFAFDAADYADGYPPIATWNTREQTRSGVVDLESGETLDGIAGAPGVATGPARVVLDPGEIGDFEPGDVLVAPNTDPSWTPLFVAASAVVVEIGAAMSHSMIVSRELGIPCVVGVKDATARIPDGAHIEVDGAAGTVTYLL